MKNYFKIMEKSNIYWSAIKAYCSIRNIFEIIPSFMVCSHFVIYTAQEFDLFPALNTTDVWSLSTTNSPCTLLTKGHDL